MINLDKATFIGEGEWVKDSAYHVYEMNNRYYACIVIGRQNKEILENSIIEILKEEVDQYV